jgi:hypothetical protein
MREFVFMVLAFSLLAVVGAEAQGTRKCAERDEIVEHLTDGFGERRRSIGLAADNSLMEVFVSEKTGTWTITRTMPNGVTCLVASGRGFETLGTGETAPEGTPL